MTSPTIRITASALAEAGFGAVDDVVGDRLAGAQLLVTAITAIMTSTRLAMDMTDHGMPPDAA
jgi:hypothetical protein